MLQFLTLRVVLDNKLLLVKKNGNFYVKPVFNKIDFI